MDEKIYQSTNIPYSVKRIERELCETAKRTVNGSSETGKDPFNITLFYSSVAAYVIRQNMTFNLSLTVSFISAGVAWFILIAEKGWRQQQFFG